MKTGTFAFLGNYVFLAILAVVASIPFWLPSYFLGIASLALVFIGLSSSWNIVAGIAGQMSLGHSIFLGLGALLSSALLIHLGINMWLGMLIAAAASAAVSAFIAWIDFRFKLSHLSFALITLAFAEMGELAFVGTEFLGGASGLSLPADKGVFSQFQFGGERGGFYVLLVTAGICVLANLLILNSRLGYHLRAMRDNENAAQAMGVNLLKSKIVAMMISAVLTSIVGTVYARYSGFVDPYQMASPHSSVEVVLFTTIGGLGTVIGPLVGAGVLVMFGEIIRGYVGGVLPGLHFLITGVLIVVVILLMPSGVVPKIAGMWRERRRSKTEGADTTGSASLPS